MLAALSGAFLLVLSFPPFDLGWAAWAALVPWLVSLERSTPRQALLRSYGAGLFFFSSTVGWVSFVTVPGMLFLIAYLSLYFAAWGWFAQRMLSRKASGFRLGISLAAAWVALEFIRSFLLSGFGWNLLAHTQWNWIRLIQVADVTGVWGVSFLVVLLNAALFDAWRQKKIALSCLCLAAALVYGTVCLRQADGAAQPAQALKVAVVQGNIPQPQKWDAAFQETIWKRYEQLTAQAAAVKPDLIVWPETAVPGFLQEIAVRRRLEQILLSAKTPVLAGVPTENLEDGSLYNSAILFGADSKAIEGYDKLHLVPFGEFVPLKPLFGWLNNVVPIGDFSAGKEFTVFQPDFPVPPFAALICFEDLFPEMSRQFVRAGARWLLVITNDGWFGRSAASLQHLQASVFRAVEDRVWIGRAANTGWSGFVDPYGRRLPRPYQVLRFKPGVAIADLPIRPIRSFYVRWGDWLPILCFGLAAWAIIKPSD